MLMFGNYYKGVSGNVMAPLLSYDIKLFSEGLFLLGRMYISQNKVAIFFNVAVGVRSCLLKRLC